VPVHGFRLSPICNSIKYCIIKVTQSDISQMENGTRKIGRRIAKRIEKLFGVDYRSFLE